MEGRLTEGSGTGVSDEGAAFELEGDPKGGGARRAGHAGEVRSRRDAKRRARARAQLNNGLPYPPPPLARALCLFVPPLLSP